MNDLFTITIFFIVGLIFGSFFNCIGIRIVLKEPFMNDRSKCPHCNHVLNWYELIPLLSFLFQHGKCLHCQKKISYVYPLIELITGSLFVFSFIQIGWKMELFRSLILISMLMIVFVSDLLYMRIPNGVLLFFFPMYIVLGYCLDKLYSWWELFIPVIVIVCIVGCIILLSKGGMGIGDLKLFAVLGIVFDWQETVMVLFIASFLGAIVGVFLLFFRYVRTMQPIPFGPYIVIASLITYFYSKTLIHWYGSLF